MNYTYIPARIISFLILLSFLAPGTHINSNAIYGELFLLSSFSLMSINIEAYKSYRYFKYLGYTSLSLLVLSSLSSYNILPEASKYFIILWIVILSLGVLYNSTREKKKILNFEDKLLISVISFSIISFLFFKMQTIENSAKKINERGYLNLIDLSGNIISKEHAIDIEELFLTNRDRVQNKFPLGKLCFEKECSIVSNVDYIEEIFITNENQKIKSIKLTSKILPLEINTFKLFHPLIYTSIAIEKKNSIMIKGDIFKGKMIKENGKLTIFFIKTNEKEGRRFNSDGIMRFNSEFRN